MRAPLLLLVGAHCVWVDEDAGRLDQDGDQIPVLVDCNDQRPDISTLEGWDGDVTCGDVVDGDLATGTNRLRVVNCVHPVQLEDLVILGRREHVFQFLSDTPTDVAATLGTDDGFVLGVDDRDTGGVALIANRGSVCELDTCEVGLPLAPAGYREADRTPDDLPPWRPTVLFHAQAREAWYVVVSGGRPVGGEVRATPYTLEVACPE